MSAPTQVATTKKGKHEIAEQITFTDEQVQLMKDTVARGATDNEFSLFMHLAQSYGLDPFLKEIWCLKYASNQPATVFTSRDGYLKIASRSPEMDGIQSDVVYQNDTLDKLPDGNVKHSYGQPRGEIIGAYALVFRKDRSRPAYFYAPIKEYNGGNNPTWKKYPSAMIVKVAEAMALKRAFSISGLVTQEEIGLDVEMQAEPETSAAVVVEPAIVLADDDTKNALRRIINMVLEWGPDKAANDTLAKLHKLSQEAADKGLRHFNERFMALDGTPKPE